MCGSEAQVLEALQDRRLIIAQVGTMRLYAAAEALPASGALGDKCNS